LGNVNVTRFGNRRDGSGGFIDITQNARRLIFSGTMTGGKFDIGVENGRLAIRRDGAFRKFVPLVGQISFSAALAAQRGQEVSYVTERAVFQLENGGVTLTEIAPGVRLQQDVLAHMGFQPRISPDLRDMDPRIFRIGPMGIGQNFVELPARPRKVA
jgi:propionate CoA-transferase